MIKLKSLLLEKTPDGKERSRVINLDTAVGMCESSCKTFINSTENKAIYRGISKHKYEYLFVSPSQQVRQSKNTANYYTLLQSNFDSWKEYPKRERSIICSNNHGVASQYGYVFLVIPFDNANIGICPSADFWFSFGFITKGLGATIDELNHILEDSYAIIFNYDKLAQDNFEHLKNSLNRFDDNKEKIKEMVQKYNGGEYNPAKRRIKFLQQYIISNMRMIDFIEYLMDPDKNQFIHTKYEEYKNIGTKDNEIWTDSDALMIPLQMDRETGEYMNKYFLDSIGKQ